jgi:hypothetical protein
MGVGDVEELLEKAISGYGPLGIGWALAVYLIWHVLSDRKKADGAYSEIVKEYHDCLVENTKAIERLSTLIDERTRIQSTGYRGAYYFDKPDRDRQN